MKISACVITKNESGNIEKCIESCKKIADEIIVADTGSEDDTVEKAENMGAKVYRFMWIDDFAAAKNFALSKATGDWIFFPDADEYIDDYTARLFKAAMKKNNAKSGAEAISAILYNIDNRSGEIKKGAVVTRIFKNTKDIRYQGRVHEALVNRKRSGQPLHIVLKDAKVYHTGYSNEILPQKQERNLKLLIAAWENGEGDSTTLYYIAGEYAVREQYQDAMEYITKLENHPDFSLLIARFDLMPNFFVIKSMVMLHLPERGGCEEALMVIEEGEKYFPGHTVIKEQKISLQKQGGQMDEALAECEKIIDIYRHEEKKTGFSHRRDRSRIMSEMARIYLMKKEKENAFDCYVNAIVEDYTYGAALTGLLDIVREQPAEEVIAFLGRMYDETIPQQRAFLTFMTAGAVCPALFFYYFYGLHEADAPSNYRRYTIYADIFHENYERASITAGHLLREEKRPKIAAELKVLASLSQILCQYQKCGKIEKAQTDESFTGALEMAIKLGKITAAEQMLDCIPEDDYDSWLKVAEMMKKIGYYDAAFDFYQLLISAMTPGGECEEIIKKAKEGMAYCSFQKGDCEEAKRRYQEIADECIVAQQFLKWMGKGETKC